MKLRLLTDGCRSENRTVTVLEHSDAGPAQYIAAHDSMISVSYATGSVRVYRLEDDTLHLVARDTRTRPGLSHLPLPEHDLLLATDKKNSILGLRLPSDQKGTAERNPLFTAQLPVSITRICHVDVRPPWKRKAALVASERNLLGTAANGSLWMFNVLRLPTWRMLRFVQNMCMRNKDLCPYPPRWVNELMHVEPTDEEAADRHVDGDILTRLVDRPNAEEVLQRMLDAEPSQNSSTGRAVDFADAAKRSKRFEQVLAEMIREDVRDESALDNGTRSSARVVQIIRSLVESPF